jgi:hypothetical protein
VPAPDVQYFLDGSIECHHIAGDTHYYFMEIAQDTNEIVDSYEDRREFERHWGRLTDMGLYMEDNYVAWRARKPPEKLFASFMGLRSVAPLLGDLAKSSASILVDENFTHFDAKARRHINERFGFENSIGLYKRTLNRAASDFSDWSISQLTEVQIAVDERHISDRALRQQIINRLTGENCDLDNTNSLSRLSARDPIKVAKIIREHKIKERKIIKRSVRFLSKLIGSETTRVFIGGHKVCFEGRHAIYELKRESNLMNSHGGFRALSIFDKDHPDLHLCDICIATPNVPLLDHVASIIMHIQAGEEEEILRIGNPSNVSDIARERDWLIPHLPKPFDSKIPIIIPDWLPKSNISQKLRRNHIESLRKHITRVLFQEIIEPHSSLVRKTNEAITCAPAEFWDANRPHPVEISQIMANVVDDVMWHD